MLFVKHLMGLVSLNKLTSQYLRNFNVGSLTYRFEAFILHCWCTETGSFIERSNGYKFEWLQVCMADGWSSPLPRNLTSFTHFFRICATWSLSSWQVTMQTFLSSSLTSKSSIMPDSNCNTRLQLFLKLQFPL